MQRLLERAAWDASDAMRVIRTFVVSGLGDPADAVLVPNESGPEKAGDHTCGVKRQYLGCAGPVASGHQRRVRQRARWFYQRARLRRHAAGP